MNYYFMRSLVAFYYSLFNLSLYIKGNLLYLLFMQSAYKQKEIKQKVDL